MGTRRLQSSTRRFLRDQRGTAAIMLSIAFPVMVGGIALGAEAGYWLMVERKVQEAADVAAHAAAVVKRGGGDQSDLEEAALKVATGTGYDAATDSLTVHDPPAIGAFAGTDGHVEVRIQRDQRRYFTIIYSSEAVPIGARAVAAVEEGANACLLALSPTAPGAVTVSGSTEVTFEGCDVASNSTAADSFLMDGGASVLSTGCVNTSGGAIATAGLTLTDCDAIREYAPAAADPYADVAEPAATGTCQGNRVGSNSATTVLTPSESHASGVMSMRFCSGLEVRGDVTFEPGLYIIEGGDFQLNSNIFASGTGVTFYLGTGVELAFNGNAEFDFSAPVSGPFSGLLYFGSRSSSAVSHTMNGTADSVMNGAIYTPASGLNFSGNFTWDGTGCTQLVAGTILFTGNSTLNVDCQAEGTRPIEVRQEVRLVE